MLEREIGARARLRTWVAQLTPARATCLFSTDVEEAATEFEQAASAEESPSTVVTLEWHALRPLINELEETVRAMASAARDVWPGLYASAHDREASDVWKQTTVELTVQDAIHRVP